MMSIHEYMSTPRSKHGGRGTHTRHVRPSSPVRSPSPKAATPCLLPHHVQHHPCATTLTPEHLRHCYGGNVGTETISATRTRTRQLTERERGRPPRRERGRPPRRERAGRPPRRERPTPCLVLRCSRRSLSWAWTTPAGSCAPPISTSSPAPWLSSPW